MTYVTEHDNEGFTFIELLVSMVIIGVLSGAALTAFKIYRERAYESQADFLLHAAQNALIAGAEGFEDSPMQWRSTWTSSPGPVRGWHGENFLPGYVNPEGVQFSAWYNGWCEKQHFDWCFYQGVDIRICDSSSMISWRKLWNGKEMVMQWAVPPGSC